MSVFGVTFVDTTNVYSEVVHKIEADEIPDAFFTMLAHEMIFNDINSPASRIIQGLDRHSNGSPGTGTSPQNIVALTPSKKNRKKIDKHTFECCCKIKGCRMNSTEVCQDCTDEN